MMKFLLTDPAGVWELTQTSRSPKSISGDFSWPCLPCACGSLVAFGCAQSQRCVCLRKQDFEPVCCMPALPGLSEMLFSPCGRYLYQLSSEADCVHTRLTSTGELLFATPAGVFPRTMKPSSDGRRLLVAGGAVRETMVFQAPELQCERIIHTRHACFAADEWLGGLVLVCAAEGEDIHTVIYTLSSRGVRPQKLLELPGQPGGLCVCPNGIHALLSTPDGLMKLDLQKGRILWNQPEWPLCMRMSCRGGNALLSDTLDGGAWLINHHRPWKKELLFAGRAAQACFLSTS